MRFTPENEKPTQFERLIQVLLAAGMDFNLNDEQSSVSFFPNDSDWGIYLHNNGKWEIC